MGDDLMAYPCRVCGALVDPGAACTRCGQIAAADPQAQNPYGQNPYGQNPYAPMAGGPPGCPSPSKRSSSGGAVAGMVVALVVVLGAVFAVTRHRRATAVTSADGTPTSENPAPAAPGTNRVAPSDEAPDRGALPPPNPRSEPIAATDPKHADPADIIRQGIALGAKVDPDAKLMSARFPGLSHGVVDVDRGGGSLTFAFRKHDPRKRVGEDVVEGGFWINVNSASLVAGEPSQNSAFAIQLQPSFPGGGAGYPLPAPTCTGARAWQAAVASGVPDDAVATLYYDRFAGQTRWWFDIEGHEELRRHIDPTSCAVLDDAGSHHPAPNGAPPPRPISPPPPPRPISPPAPPPPTPRRTGACGCPSDDLMCIMKCNSKKARPRAF